MIKGFLSGLLWGSMVSVVAVLAASLNAPLPGPQAASVEVPQDTPFERGLPPSPLLVPETEPAGVQLIAPQADTPPQPEPVPLAETDPDPAPSGPEAPAAPAAPVPEPQSPVIRGTQADRVPQAAPSTPSTPGLAETAPATERLALADPPASESPDVLVTPDAAATQPAPSPASEPQSADAAPSVAPPEAPQIDIVAEAAPEPQPAPAPAPQVAPEPEPAPQPEPTPDPAPTPQAAPAPTPAPTPEPAAVAQLAPAPAPEPSSPAAADPTASPTVLAQAAPVESTQARTVGSLTTPQTGPTALGGALQRNAMQVPLTPGLPLFSVVIVDRSGTGLPLADIAGFPAPLTVALDPRNAGALEAAEGYRATGHEVLVLADALPAEATVPELSALMADLLSRLPMAVGVLLPNDSPIVRDRARIDALTALLARTGHGLVAQPQGLDTLGQAAQAAGVPEAKVFSLLDARDESAPLIQRYLDRAAFEAERTAQVVVVGEARPDTLNALGVWIEGRRAGTVAVAPVSALMLSGN